MSKKDRLCIRNHLFSFSNSLGPDLGVYLKKLVSNYFYWRLYIQKKLIDLINQYIMYISNQRFRVVQLTEKNIPQSAAVLVDVFIRDNPTWKTLNPKYTEALTFMNAKLRQMVEWQNQLRQSGIINTPINFAYINDQDQVVAVYAAIEWIQYLSRKSKVFLKEFGTIEHYRQELQKSILDIDKKVPGLAIYCMFIGVKNEYIGRPLKFFFFYDISHVLHQKGLRIQFARSSNIKSLSLITKLGGHVTAQIKGKENGKQITLHFTKWYLDPLNKTKHNFKQKANL